MGRLTKDTNQAGGLWSLVRTETPTGHSVTMASAMGRTKTYLTEITSTGVEQSTSTSPAGLVTRKTTGTDGVTTVTSPDGAITTTKSGPDPRWQMQSPVTTSETVKLPSGLTYAAGTQKFAILSVPANPMSLTKLTETVTVNGQVYTSVYDATLKTITATSPAGRVAVATLDAKGKITQEAVTGLAPVAYAYDARGRLATLTGGTGVDARQSSFVYDVKGYLASIADPLGGIIGYTYDGAGRVTNKTLKDGRTVSFAYDANGNVTSVTPPSRPAHSFGYTAVDQESAYMPPAVGGATATLYGYNLDKQITLITRPDGQSIGFNYDVGGRLSSVAHPGGTIAYAYDTATGNLASVSAPSGETLSYTYDGSLPLSTTWVGAVAGTVSRAYDNNFRVTSLSVNGLNATAYVYDADGLITGAGSLAVARNAQNGLITGSTLGGITTANAFNTFGEIVSERHTGAGATLYDAQYTRDKLGRITQKIETIGGVAKTYAYAYDAAGRLTSVSENGAVVSAYAYDANGNRLGKTDAVGTTAGTHDAQDRLLTYGANAYAYTANGELLAKTNVAGTTGYSYDVLGNLVSATLPDGTLVEYVIDGANRRVGKKVNGVLVQGWLYANQLNPIAELDGAGNVISTFVYGTKANVPDYMVKGGVTYRIISDYLGSPRLVVDSATGTIVQSITYDEFGNVITDTNPGFQPFGFAGGLYDRNTKLTRFGARDYDAETGRWTAKDPIRFAGGDTNLYGYVLNDPVNFIDEYGLYWEYSQSSGQLTHIDNQTGARTQVGTGYAGAGLGKNNPNMQNVPNVGPIPQGNYTIGNATTRGPLTLPLTPHGDTNTFGRSGFRLHGDNSHGDQSASKGCIVATPNVRSQINNSPDRELRVIK